jgi:hypothetical protein
MVPHEVRAVVVSVHRLRYVVFTYLPTYLPACCLPSWSLGVVTLGLSCHHTYIHTYIRTSLSWSHWVELVSHIHTYLAIAFCYILTPPSSSTLWLFGVVGYLACISAVSASATPSRTLVSIYQTTPTRAQSCVGSCHYVLNNLAERDKRQSNYILNSRISLYNLLLRGFQPQLRTTSQLRSSSIRTRRRWLGS